MNLLKDVPSGPEVPKVINVIIECPARSRNKFELDKKTGLIKLDRVLYSSVHYPGDYGFMPQSLWDDGDPLDVLVIAAEPTYPGVLIEARPIGAIEMVDKGEDDIKIIAVNKNNPMFDHIKDIKDLPPHQVKEIRHFFEVYKQLQGAKVEINDTLDKTDAEQAVLKSIKAFKLSK